MTRIFTATQKSLLFLTLFSIFCATGLSAQVFISEDFNSVTNPGLPTGWTSTPASKWITGAPNTVMPYALSGLNLSLNNAAHTKAVGIDGHQATADGAKITSPLISLPASATNAVLMFDVAYFGSQAGSGTPPPTEELLFIVSTNGGTTWSDISFVSPLTNPSNSVWDSRSIPIGAYAGQSNLKFGFRYDNDGGSLVGAVLDNIRLVNGTDGIVASAFAGDHPDPSTGTGYQLAGTNAILTGTVRNTGATTINSYYIKYRVGTGGIQSSSLIATPVAPLATVAFPVGLIVSIPTNANYTIKTWIEATGDIDHSNDTFSATTIGVPSVPLKRPLFEEGTGTWCGWCPRGAVFMDHFAATHPSGAASQIAVHNNDPMAISAYTTYMDNYIGGYPNLVIDRTIEKDPRTIDTAFIVAQNNFGFADFVIGAPLYSNNSVSIPVVIKPVVTISNPKLALVITESNVKGTGGNWPQTNYYSGSGSGIMGGWENQPDHVPGVHFHFVARIITPSPEGNVGTLPTTLTAGLTYNAVLSATLDSGWKRTDLQCIALLINGNNTSVMNTASTSLPSLTPALGNGTAVTNVGNDIEQAIIYPNPTSGKSFLNIKLKQVAKAVVTVTDISGRILLCKTQQLQAGNNNLTMETGNLAAGCYFVNVATNRGNVSLRLLVVK